MRESKQKLAIELAVQASVNELFQDGTNLVIYKDGKSLRRGWGRQPVFDLILQRVMEAAKSVKSVKSVSKDSLS